MSAAGGAAARLDLRGTACPLNYVRSRLALEALPSGARLELLLDAGEPEQMVAEGLRSQGHRVDALPPLDSDAGVRLIIERDGGRP